MKGHGEIDLNEHAQVRFEVIIPTVGGREHYLYWALRSCLDQDYPLLSVLVSNNGGAPGVRETLAGFADSRLRYVEAEAFLPMSAHWEFAVAHAQADVITIIGDDDALMPNIFHRLNDFFSTSPNVHCITHNPAQYYWPDFPIDQYRDLFRGARGTGSLQVLETKPILRLVSEFRDWYGHLPLLYHGFVRKTVLDGIRMQRGRIFERICPDVYCDIMLATVLDCFAHLDDCLTIGGQGAKSNGANFLLNTDEGRSFVSDLPDYLIPVFSPRSINLQVYEYVSMVRRLLDCGEDLQVAWLRFAYATLMEALRSSEHRNEILSDLLRIARSRFPFKERLATEFLTKLLWTDRVCRPLRRLLSWRQSKLLAGWENASATCEASNVYELAQCLSGAGRRSA
jgi:hypothetical protein